MDRTVTAVLVAAIMAMSCCVLLVSDDGDAAETKQVGSYDELAAAITAANNGDTIELSGNIEINAMLVISKSITLDLKGFSVTSSTGFQSTDDNSKHLVDITSNGVVIKNGTLKTTNVNNHALNVYMATGVVIEDMVLDNTATSGGAPMIVNSSSVTLSGNVTFITGDASWYAANVGNNAGSASVTTGEEAKLTFTGSNPAGFVMEPVKDSTDALNLTFGNETTVISDIDNFTLSGLFPGSDDTYVDIDETNAVINSDTEPNPEPTPTPGYDDEEDLPPYIPSQSSNDDDTVTIVACAAAAAVAAILAVFLVIDRK